MKSHVLVFLFTAALLVLGTGGIALNAEDSALKFKSEYEFTAGDVLMPGGSYRVQIAKGSRNSLAFQNLDTQEIFLVPFLSRVSEKKRESDKGQVVFENHEGKAYISEVYIPGMDGFHLAGVPGRHTHNHP